MLARLVLGHVERLVAVGDHVSTSTLFGGCMSRGTRIEKILGDVGLLLEALGKNEIVNVQSIGVKLALPSLRAWYALLLNALGVTRYSISGVRGGLILRVSDHAADALARVAKLDEPPARKAVIYLVAASLCTSQVRDVLNYLVKRSEPQQPEAKMLEAIIAEEKSKGVKHSWVCSITLCKFDEKNASYTLPSRRVSKSGVLLTIHATTRQTILPVTLALAGIITLRPDPDNPAEPVKAYTLTNGYRRTLENLYGTEIARVEALSNAIIQESLDRVVQILPEAREVIESLCT